MPKKKPLLRIIIKKDDNVVLDKYLYSMEELANFSIEKDIVVISMSGVKKENEKIEKALEYMI